MEAYVKRELGRAQREFQMLKHQTHVCCLISHLRYLNSFAGFPPYSHDSAEILFSIALSIIPKVHSVPSKDLNMVRLASFVSWFKSAFQCLNDDLSGKQFPENVSDWLTRAMENFICTNPAQRVILFLLAARSLGWPTRLVLNLDPVSTKPGKSLSGKLSDILEDVVKKPKIEEVPDVKEEKSPEKEAKKAKSKSRDENIKDKPGSKSSKSTKSSSKEASKCEKERSDKTEKLPNKSSRTSKSSKKDTESKSSKSKHNESKNSGRDVKDDKSSTKSSSGRNRKSNEDSGKSRDSKSSRSKDSKEKSRENDETSSNSKDKRRSSSRSGSRKDESTVDSSKKTSKADKSSSKEPKSSKKPRLSDTALLEANKRANSKRRATKSDYFTRTNSDSDSDFDEKSRRRKSPKISSPEKEEDEDQKKKKKPVKKSGHSKINDRSKKGLPYWCEVYVTTSVSYKSGWVTVDIDQGRVNCAQEMEERCGIKPLLYVIAANADGTLKDVTR